MQVSAEQVATAFADLISGARSREAIAAWAKGYLTDDPDEVSYLPPSKEEALWDALTYLVGVDLKTSPSQYLHTVADFEEEWAVRRARIDIDSSKGRSDRARS